MPSAEKSARLTLVEPSTALSVVIPLAPQETQWLSLCRDFHLLPPGSQVILVPTAGDDIEAGVDQLKQDLPQLQWLLLSSAQGRALQLNTGAAQAKHPFIWFLHADSRITRENINHLLALVSQHNSRQYLFYFDLYFFDKTSRLLKLNEWGANMRSRLLGIPFGDQGFCLSSDVFKALGGYDQQASYGEDHLLVWQAKQQGIKLKPCYSKLATSARKYQDKGWSHLTLKYQLLWPRQALPQCWQLLKIMAKRRLNKLNKLS